MSYPGNQFFDEELGLPIIGGYARMASGGNGYFRTVLYSHVMENLWQGGTPAELSGEWLVDANGDAKFDKILCLYPWESYDVPPGTELVEVELYDAEDVDDTQIDELAMLVVDWLETGEKVLVHCQAGLNRSALVSARALMIWKGMSAKEAISLLREQRCDTVLCNPYFERYLLALDGSYTK